MPLPEHYLLGLDDQTFDVDSGRYYKYLRGELRSDEPGWYHYYVYALLVKTPLGALALGFTAAAVGVVCRRYRADTPTEVLLLTAPLSFLLMLSAGRGLNSHLRYLLPAFPFVFVSAGRLGPWSAGSRVRGAAVVAALVVSAASVVTGYPFYLSYFNEAAGGPDRGITHLAESNLDWGQGLLALRDWLGRHAPGRPLKLAYHGTTYPELLGISYELPPFGPDVLKHDSGGSLGHLVGPAPGLQAVIANYVIGFPFPAPNAKEWHREVPRNAYRYYRHFRPKAVVAHSIFVYDISPDEADRVRRKLRLPPWATSLEVGRPGQVPMSRTHSFREGTP